MKKLFFLLAIPALFLIGCSDDLVMDTDTDQTYQIDERANNWPDMMNLPTGFEGEGIERGKGRDFFVSSLGSGPPSIFGGAIYKGDFKTGELFELVAPFGEAAVGMSYDERSDLLWVAGDLGKGLVYNGTTGDLVVSYQLGDPVAVLINDVLVTSNAAYFTDSYNTWLYKIDLGPAGQPGENFEVVHMDGFIYDTNPAFFGINANGIVGGSNKLIVNNMASGLLYLIDPEAETATPIPIAGEETLFFWGDGLLIDGNTLYICQNFPNKVAVVQLSNGWTSGTFVKNLFSDDYVEPATITRFGNYIYAINAHFFEKLVLGMDPSTLSSEIVRVPK